MKKYTAIRFKTYMVEVEANTEEEAASQAHEILDKADKDKHFKEYSEVCIIESDIIEREALAQRNYYMGQFLDNLINQKSAMA